MIQSLATKHWTINDLEKLSYNEWNRYEIINGELFVTRAPHYRHQRVSMKLSFQIEKWSQETRLGEIIATPGLIYSDSDNVIPDLAWVRSDRIAELLDDSGHFQGSPDLVIEVLSYGKEDKRRDRDLKLKLYSREQVIEYWIVDWRKQQIEIYCLTEGSLILHRILHQNDQLTSATLPDFSCNLSEIFV
jgi:Uma2 family endonuclease